ncbi:Clr5 domain-containing protein [Podospora appendiculata]|uniref:Clr5 domain-containing protein n=1 Tax=Podospora appendiculata TaxID=314037 RepID=A0AAE1CBY5_9PEZI|nr:Clr5 domain-containing protein [Podospora appendiculata]
MARFRGPSGSEWERHRQIIAQLYLDDNMSLDRVMHTMGQRFPLFQHATRKMYKRRFRQWGWSKNCRAADLPAIVSQIGALQPTKTSSTLLLRGRPVGMYKVYSFLKRRKRSSKAETEPTKEEYILLAIREYIDASSSGIIWNPGLNDRVCMSTTAGTAGRFRLAQFHDTMLAAIALSDEYWHKQQQQQQQQQHQDLETGIKIIDGCMAGLAGVLKDQDPFLLGDMLDVLCRIGRQNLPGNGHRQLLKIVLDHLEGLSVVVLTANHPLTRVWHLAADYLTTESQTDSELSLPALLTRGIHVILATFTVRSGRRHAATQIMSLHALEPQDRATEKEKAILDHLLNLVQSSPHRDTSAYQLRFCVARNFLNRGHVAEATRLLEELEHTDLYQSHHWQLAIRSDASLSYEYLLLAGYLGNARGGKEEALGYLREALWVAELAWGLSGPFAMAALAHLKTCAMGWC